MNEKMNNSIKSIRPKTLGIVIAVVCFFAIGFTAGRLTNSGIFPGNLINQDKKEMTLFWDIWNTLKSQYVDDSKINEDNMYYGAIKGMVDALGDPATLFLTPKETEAWNKSIEGKSFQGIGAELSYEKSQIIVVAPIAGSPAEKAGIKSGDVIYKVDGKEIGSNETIYDVVAKIRGEAGTKVKLTIIRKGEIKPLEFEITRGEIDVPSIELKDASGVDNVKVMRISRFTEDSVATWNANWDKAVREIVASKAKGLIIDLRGNPGGFFDSAIYAGNEFLPKGTILAKQANRKGKEDVFRVTREGKLQNIPLVVLVDDGSASASEILSGLLQQNKRATLVGVNTYGKGTAQTIVNYSDGSSLHITILKWLLPNGQWLNRDNPIKPDVNIEYPEDEFKKGNDVQLNKAIEIIKSKI